MRFAYLSIVVLVALLFAAEALAGAEQAGSEQVVFYKLQPEWRFAPDPKNVGKAEQWFAHRFDDAQWATVRTDQGSGWESQGFSGYTGYGWYRLTVEMPCELIKNHIYLSFEAVDEDAWIYINGELALDHSCAATGLTPNEIWTTPFAFEVSKHLKEGLNDISVRIRNTRGMGGIWKPVYLFAGDLLLEAKAFINLYQKPGFIAAVKDMTAGSQIGRIPTTDLAWLVRKCHRPDTARINGQRMCHIDLEVRNISPQKRDVEVRCLPLAGAVKGQGVMSERLEFDAGQSRTHRIEFPLSRETAVSTMTVQLIDPNTSRLLFNHSFYLDLESLSWKPHFVRQADGKGGYKLHPARYQLLRRYNKLKVIPYGLARMDNGQIAVTGAARNEQTRQEQGVIAFSSDSGATWSDFIPMEGYSGHRPVMTTFLGNGKLYVAGHLSRDYGRTWERVEFSKASNGGMFAVEGNALVDFGEDGVAAAVAMTGWQYEGDRKHPRDPATCMFRWSYDGGETWQKEVRPEAWLFDVTFAGKRYPRGNSEGGLVRAANGWIVAALRSDMPPHYFDLPFTSDHLEGTAISISKDNGQTWSRLKFLFLAGRHHCNLLRLPNNDLVLTVIRRVDIRDGKLASYRRGCDAIVSKDNGVTWDVDRMYILDEFPYCDSNDWVAGQCGHLASISMEDGSVLTAYGNYLAGGVLIRWNP